jgi:putative ABC transport system permease protein
VTAAAALFTALVTGYARANVLRAAVTVIAVALGVAAFYAISLANATAVASFAKSVDVIADRVNLQVFAIGRGFDERTLLRVQAIPGVRLASPVVEGEIVAGSRAGDMMSGEILHVLGVDITRGQIPADAAAAGARADFDMGSFIDDRGAIVSERVARAYHAPAGATLVAYSGARLVRLRVMGVIPQGAAGVDSSVAFVDIATAQELFDSVGRLTRIDLQVDPARLAAVKTAVEAVVPGNARVLEPRSRIDEIARMLASFRMNLAALADVALLVGMYLIYNAVAISVVQRTAEVGTLRALGATRRQIFTTFLLEGALYGTIGAVVGLVLGYAFAGFAVSAVQLTVSTLYVGSHADAVVVTLPATLEAFALGVGLAMLSAIAPAIVASRTAPARTMRAGGGVERRVPGSSSRYAVAGVVLLLIGAALLRAPAIDGQPLCGYLAGVFAIAGASLLTPLLLALAVRALAAWPRPSATITIAIALVRGSPGRFAIAIASLAVAVAMTTAIAILVGSFRATVVAWTADTLGADLYVKTPGAVDASFAGRFKPADVARVARVHGVLAVDTYRGIDVPVNGRFAELGATNIASFASRSKLRFIGHVDVAQLAQSMQDGDVVVVSEPFYQHFGLGTGDHFEIPTARGRRTMTIGGVYNDYSTSGGTFIMDRARFQQLFDDDSADTMAIYLQPGYEPSTVRTAVERALLPLRVDISTNRELRGFAISIFDRTFAITSALYVISLSIAILGVVSTLFALVIERRLDIALLRYLGLRGSGVRTVVVVQAALVGIVAAVAGLLLGIGLAVDLIYVINLQSFGWLIEWKSPGAFYVEAVVLVVAAALLASLYPARVAARIRTAEVLRVE